MQWVVLFCTVWEVTNSFASLLDERPDQIPNEPEQNLEYPVARKKELRQLGVEPVIDLLAPR
jgi:hypothetical protein